MEIMMDSYYELCRKQYYCPAPITCAMLAHAYVPFQYLMCLYPPLKGLERGTIFPELDREYGADPEYTVDA
jgi:hypothetical protein